MAGGLELVDHYLEAVDGGEILLAHQVIAADIHFLAGEMVTHQIELHRGVTRIGRVREARHHVGEGALRELGIALVARHVLDLLVIAKRAQVKGIGRAAITGMEFDEPLQGRNGIVIGVDQIIGIGRHQLRLRRPFRIGVLALDFVEQFCRLAGFAGLQRILGVIIENLDRGLRNLGLRAGTGAHQASGENGRDHPGVAIPPSV